MPQVLSVALLSMQHDMARLDRVAMNLANAQTVGYKRDMAHAPSFADRLRGLEVVHPAPVGADAAIDQRPGSLRPTDQRLDVALAGPGWFEVQTADGIAYTRQGSFRLDPQGRLATAGGQLVMGLGGEIHLPHGMPVIDTQGRIFEGALPGAAPGRTDGAPLAQLKVVQFDDPAGLQRLGAGLVRFEGHALPVEAAHLQVRQGFLENSNVEPMQEMVQLVQAMRHFESMQKAAVGYDEMVGAAIRRLDEPA